jgi:ubiquitin-like domain-containing CTD phosphatase 1
MLCWVQWVEVKMRELGVLGNEFYKIVTLLDHAAMLTVNTDKYGVFDCKPLAFIWAKFPEQYTEENTVMLDDLRWGAAG